MPRSRGWTRAGDRARFRVRAVASLVALTLVALAAAPAVPAAALGQGRGNPVLTVSPATVAADRVTTVTVTGTDYLVPPHDEGVDVFGGVYVFFGWVADPERFGPSIRSSENNDGTFAVTYAYPGDGGDPSTRDDGTGTMALVAFTPGGESGEATPFHMDRDGNWTATLRIYGSQFTTTNPITGETSTYDCQTVECGVFTIGAHGISSATNERFIPITFGDEPGAAIPADPGDGGGGEGAPGDGGTATTGGDGGAPPPGDPGGATTGRHAGNATPTVGAGDGGHTEGDDAADDTGTDANDEIPAAQPTSSTTATADDGEALALAVTSTRSTASGTPLVLAVAVIVAILAVTAGFRWRRNGKARPN